jgi:hypothetical protein
MKALFTTPGMSQVFKVGIGSAARKKENLHQGLLKNNNETNQFTVSDSFQLKTYTVINYKQDTHQLTFPRFQLRTE